VGIPKMGEMGLPTGPLAKKEDLSSKAIDIASEILSTLFITTSLLKHQPRSAFLSYTASARRLSLLLI
jgi:hypothetical protein